MNVGDLISVLEDMPEDKEIRIAFQPSWPLRAQIQSVADGEEMIEERPRCVRCGEFATCTIEGREYPLCDEHGMAEEQPLEHLELDDPPDGDVGTFVWIAIDQISSYSENPYAPREAWQ
jgi:hypothetical protein